MAACQIKPTEVHLAALASLKGEIIDLNTQLQHVCHERDLLEKLLNKTELEKLMLVQDHDDRLDQQAIRYEERLTELHAVITELSKKINNQRINIIREEDECSHVSGTMHSHGTSNDNNPNESCTDNEEVMAELSRAVNEMEHRQHQQAATGDKEVCKQAEHMESAEGMRKATPPCQSALPVGQMQEELIGARAENSTLQEQLGRQEAELNRTRASFGSLREERDRLRRKVRELQSKLQGVQSHSSQGSQTGSPTRSKSPYINPTTGERTPTSTSRSEEIPFAKIAERVKLKKVESGDRHILGSEISSMGVSSSKVAEHLVQPLQDESSAQEIFTALYSTGSQVSENRVREFEVETERLHSRIEHLKSQNDLVSLTLEESKSQCDRLSVLIGKYESNNTALQLALGYSDQALETSEALIALLDSETGLLLANCHAAGLGALARLRAPSAAQDTLDDSGEVAALLRQAQENRRSAETVARHLLQRFDRSCDVMCGVMGCTSGAWDDLSSHSHTTSTTSSTSSSCDTDFSKGDELRLREHVTQLKEARLVVHTTIMELESVHVDPLAREPSNSLDSQKLDLENAVLMQELMAMKEEKAELKAHVYLLERERVALELRLSSRDAQEQAYVAHVEHLKTELREQQQAADRLRDGSKNTHNGNQDGVCCYSESSDDLAQELTESIRREKKLKFRLQELVSTLEKVTKNSELRHQQSAEFVNDLKRANSALVAAFEKSKKKYQSKIKKMEQQLLLMVDRHAAQVRLLKQRIAILEENNLSKGLQPAASETSL